MRAHGVLNQLFWHKVYSMSQVKTAPNTKIYVIYKADTQYHNIDAFLRAGAERSEAPASLILYIFYSILVSDI